MLKTLFDLGPLVIFFVVYKLYGLMPATIAIIAATTIAVLLVFVLERRIPLVPLITAVIVAVFGGLTIYLQDETFIKMKPTIINLLFAAVLLGGLLAGKPLLKPLFGSAFQLTDKGWVVLTRRWGLFFLFLAGLNEIVWRHYPTDIWVDFKVFGLLGLTLVFSMLQLPLMTRSAALVAGSPEETQEKP